MPRFRVYAIDCDGEGSIGWAPTFDNEVEANVWIHNFMADGDTDIQRIWVEEEDDNE